MVENGRKFIENLSDIIENGAFIPFGTAPGTQPGDRHTPSSISNNLDSQGNLNTQGYRELYESNTGSHTGREDHADDATSENHADDATSEDHADDATSLRVFEKIAFISNSLVECEPQRSERISAHEERCFSNDAVWYCCVRTGVSFSRWRGLRISSDQKDRYTHGLANGAIGGLGALDEARACGSGAPPGLAPSLRIGVRKEGVFLGGVLGLSGMRMMGRFWVVLWTGVMVKLYCERWYGGIVELWNCGTVYCGTVELWNCGMVVGNGGTMVWWYDGIVELWYCGTVDRLEDVVNGERRVRTSSLVRGAFCFRLEDVVN
eukprot:gene10319-biopygen220